MAFLLCFFSSRRRHTRCSRDWSSDVCSSDLRLSRSILALKDLGCGRQCEKYCKDCCGQESHMQIEELMGLIGIELQTKNSPLTRMPDNFRLGSNGPLHSASRRAARRAVSAVY